VLFGGLALDEWFEIVGRTRFLRLADEPEIGNDSRHPTTNEGH
jgi:hypothetical protein